MTVPATSSTRRAWRCRFVAYGATFRVVGPNGERDVAAADYFTMPNMRNVRKENVLADDEILTHVMLPAPGTVKTGHYEVRFKQSHDWPLAMTTVVLTMNGNTIRSARVVLGAVAPVPWRSRPAEAALAGKPLNAETAAAAAEAAVSEAKPMSGNVYKVQIARTAVKRAILQAAGNTNSVGQRAEGSGSGVLLSALITLPYERSILWTTSRLRRSRRASIA